MCGNRIWIVEWQLHSFINHKNRIEFFVNINENQNFLPWLEGQFLNDYFCDIFFKWNEEIKGMEAVVEAAFGNATLSSFHHFNLKCKSVKKNTKEREWINTQLLPFICTWVSIKTLLLEWTKVWHCATRTKQIQTAWLMQELSYM